MSGFVEIYLSDEDKFRVLLLAFGLFVFTLLCAICLALSCCPLNKWLLERHSRRKRQQQFYQQQHCITQSAAPVHYLLTAGGGPSKAAGLARAGPRQAALRQASNVSYGGPPPAYEAALRATRLQSLTGALPHPPNQQQQQEESQKSSQWPPQMVYERQLDLGDYFHQPKEFNSLEPDSCANLTPASPSSRQTPPVMLRLWVRMMEPGELVQRARGSARSESKSRPSLSRQLSIPQLFGSLVTLASGKQQPQIPDAVEAEREMHSIVSSSSSSGGGDAIIETKPNQQEEEEEDTKVVVEPEVKKQPPPPRRRSSSFMAINSVTSRVLHMNVASFSYVRDEQLISTKKHNQLNYHHFFTSPSANRPPTPEQQNSKTTTNQSKLCQLVISICDIENILSSCWSGEKSCALLAYSSAIYVQCEILLPKSKSARLLSYPLKALGAQSQTSSNLTASGVAGNPKRATHTVNFSTAIPAAALERHQQPAPSVAISQHLAPPQSILAASVCSEPSAHHLQVSGDHNANSSADTSLCGSVMSGPASCSTASSATMSPPTSGSGVGGTQSSNHPNTSTTTTQTSTNWRHEPHGADGKSIVIFNSVPKQIAHEQELAAASYAHQQETDLIQFDSVFVSPILSKSTIEEGYLRFRVYSQCKYVNETCLAELKLPLKQLLRSQTRDNLGDASLTARVASDDDDDDDETNQQKQADFILDNLLENLVTANTGSPLSTLIEQISSEEREAEQLALTQEQPATQSGAMSVFGRLPWLLSQQDQAAGADSRKLKLSSSLNESLYRLGNQAAAIYQSHTNSSDSQLYLANQQQAQDQDQHEREQREEERRQQEHDQLMERNYCRSLMVSHWLNYLVAPSYECQSGDDSKGKIILGLTFLPTSNRLIFNAHKASIEGADTCGAPGGKHLMKNLQLQSSTCYLLRFLMVVGGRVAKRKQTAVGRRPEWDIQEPITFDLASVSVSQPHFIVALVMRNATTNLHSSTGCLQTLQHKCCNCSTATTSASGNKSRTGGGAQSEPESRQLNRLPVNAAAARCSCSDNNGNGGAHHMHGKRDLVIGHMVVGEEMWRELRLKPRKQIVRQFKIY